MDDGFYIGETRVSLSMVLVIVALALSLIWFGVEVNRQILNDDAAVVEVAPTPPIQLPTLMPTQPVPPRATVYAAQPQVVNDGGGNVSIVNNYTYINQDVDVCVALVCE